MKKFMQLLLDELYKIIENNQKPVLIKLEGFESAEIYSILIESLFNEDRFKKFKILARLSIEKYNEFNKNPKNFNFLQNIKKYNCISNDSLTKLRNEAAQYLQTNSNDAVIFMGTELIQDKGSLEDFFTVNMEYIIQKLGNNYSKFFDEIFDEIDDERNKAINEIYKTIFKYRNIDLLKLSFFVDNIGKNIRTIDDLIEKIFNTLNEYWDLPPIRSEHKIPLAKNIIRDKRNSSLKIIEEAAIFIDRKNFKDILTEKKEKDLIDKFNNYASENRIKLDDHFPESFSLFNNYYEFSESVIDFINGKDIKKNREKLMKLDFAIISDILNIKIKKEKSKKEEVTIKGSPLEVYEKMIILSINKYYNEIKEFPNQLTIIVDEIKLSNVVTDEDKKEMFRKLVTNLKGIVGYINNKNLNIEGEIINIQYKNNKDVFDMDFFDYLDINSTSNLNDLCKIKFIIEANDKKYKYTWKFSPYDYWLKNFILFNDYDEEYLNDNLPIYLVADDIERYVNCSNDKEFFVKIDNIYIHSLYKQINNKINNLFDSFTKQHYQNVLVSFKEFIKSINNDGWFNSIINKEAINFIDNYNKMIKYIRENFEKYDSIQKSHLHYFLNMFLILGDNGAFDNLEIKEAIAPPYHPVILEKYLYQTDFLGEALVEIFEILKEKKFTSDARIESLINKYIQLSQITDGLEFLPNRLLNYILTHNMHGLYGIYIEKESIVMESSLTTEDLLLDDDEDIEDKLNNTSAISKIIEINIKEYLRVFPARKDCLRILMINPKEIQSIVTGLHEVIDYYRKNELTLNIELFVIISDYKVNTIEYLRYWLDNYFDEDEAINIKTYIKVFNLNSKKFENEIKEDISKVDITIIFDLFSEAKIILKEDFYNNNNLKYKFPMIKVPEPVTNSMNSVQISISQPQFELARNFTQAMYLLKENNIRKDIEYRLVKELQMKDFTQEIIDIIHDYSVWVLCIDEALNRDVFLKDGKKRIISFTTGEGDNGDLNITLSSKESFVEDIAKDLEKRLRKIFKSWDDMRIKTAAYNCIRIAQEIENSRLLKALNPFDYQIYNFLSYILTLQNINSKNSKTAIRTIISADFYNHWFYNDINDKDKQNSKRPDLVLLEIIMDDENMDINKPLKIKVTSIECKMSIQSEKINENKAIDQVESGIEILARRWTSSNTNVDCRYWFGQLYRALVFSKTNLNENSLEYKILHKKIHNILFGQFIIDWNGEVYIYDLNFPGEFIGEDFVDTREELKEIGVDKIKVHKFGQIYIQKMLMPENERTNNFEFEIINLENEMVDQEIENDDDNGKTIFKYNNSDKFKDEEKAKNEDKIMIKFESKLKVAENDKKELTDEIMLDDKNELDLKDSLKEKINNKDLTSIRVLIGKDLKTNEKIYWEFGNKQLNNRHLLISGNSGSGKTYCIQMLLYELSKQGISSIVFDYTNGFSKTKLDKKFVEILGNKLKEKVVYKEKFPLNPFKKMEQAIGDEKILEKDSDAAIRVSNIFKAIYDFGDQQLGTLYSAILSCYKKYGDYITLEKMIEELEQDASNYAKTIVNKIRPFVDSEPFDYNNSFSWNDIIESDGIVYIIQLNPFNRDTQLLITEFILWDIWNYALKYGDESKPIPIILDEAQNLDHSEKSPTAKILTEGRKFGLSGWFATQFLKKQLKDDEIQRLQQAGQKLYFSPPEAEINEIAQYVINKKDKYDIWIEKIKTLKKGECVAVGYGLDKNNQLSKYEPKILKITSMEERLNGE